MSAPDPERSATPTDHPDFTAAIYGSLLVTTLTIVQWQQDVVAERVGLSLVTSVVVFWLAHVWAEVVNKRMRRPVGVDEGMRIARSEATMLTAAILPALILGLPRLVGMDTDTALGLALAVCFGQLFLWGLAVGRSAHASWPMALLVACVDLGLGILIVGLKVIVIH